MNGVRQLAQHCHLIGADICGERAAVPLRGLWKRLDAVDCSLGHPCSAMPTRRRMNASISCCWMHFARLL